MTRIVRALVLFLCASPIAAQSVKLVTVTITTPALALGGRTTATATVRLANGTYTTTRPITWGTTTPGVAVVSTKGVVSTIAAGTTTITAQVANVVGSATLTVNPGSAAAVATVTTSLVASTVLTGQTTSATAVARDSSGNVLTGRSVAWSTGSTTVAGVTSGGLVTALAAGTTAVRASVEGQHGDATLTVTAPTPTPPDTTATPTTPTVLTTTLASTPSTGRTLTVASGGNLQAALDSSIYGDRITLTCGATYSGNYVLRSKSGGIANNYIRVTTTCTIPAEGTRTSPAQQFATISSPSVSPAISTIGPASRWRFIGVNVTTSSASNQGLVSLGCGTSCESDTASLPRDIIFDRSYIHAPTTTDGRRCMGVHGLRMAVIESYIAECHSAGFDAQAIVGWNGPGPFKIVNNYLEASTEVVAFGGADPAIAGLVPSDIEIRGNHITHQIGWKGGPWLIKNLIEIKASRRLLITGNVLENNWPAGQNGYAVVLWSVNQSGGCTWCVTEQVTFELNVLKNVASGFQVTASYSTPSIPLNHVTIRNNVVIGMDNTAIGDGSGRGFLIGSGIGALAIDHNTLILPPTSSTVLHYDGPGLTSHRVTDNLFGGGRYPITMAQVWSAIADTASRWTGNVLATADAEYFAVTRGGLPGSNAYLAGPDSIGFAGGGALASSVNATLDNLTLLGGSDYLGKGANITLVKAATLNVTAVGATRTP